MEDKARPGGPPILGGAEEELDINVLREHPSQPSTAICKIQSQTGKSIQLSGKRQTIHVLGVENSRSGKTTAYLHRGSIKADTVIACIDDFANHVRKTTAFVLDNASQHTCKKVAKLAPEWEKRGLVFFPIPPALPSSITLSIYGKRCRSMPGAALRRCVKTLSPYSRRWGGLSCPRPWKK